MLFNNFTYSIPDNKEKMLFDFYAISFCRKMPAVKDNILDYRYENFNENLQYISEIVFSEIEKELKRVIVFACASELYHFINQTSFRNSLSYKYLYSHNLSEKYPKKYLKEDNHRIDRYIKALSFWGSDENIIENAIKIFSIKTWSSSFGGESWKNIAEAYIRLKEASTLDDKMIYIDHIFDLQHNNGTFFNKLNSYRVNDNFCWINRSLQYKSKIDSGWYLYGFCSESINKILAFYLKNNGYDSFAGFLNRKNTNKSDIYHFTYSNISTNCYSDDFVRDVVIKAGYNLSYIPIFKKMSSEKNVMKFIDLFEYDTSIQTQSLQNYFSLGIKVSMKFIMKYYDVIISNNLLCYVKDSESFPLEFVEKNIDSVNWKNISYYQILSDEFIIKYLDKINFTQFCFKEKCQFENRKFYEHLNADHWEQLKDCLNINGEVLLKYVSKENLLNYQSCTNINPEILEKIIKVQDRNRNYKATTFLSEKFIDENINLFNTQFLFQRKQFSESFLQKHGENNWDRISYEQKMSNEFIKSNLKNVVFTQIITNGQITKSQLCKDKDLKRLFYGVVKIDNKFIEKVGLQNIFYYIPKQKIKESILQKLIDLFHSDCDISLYQKLSEKFIKKNVKYLGKHYLCKYQKLSQEIIENNYRDLGINNLEAYKLITKEQADKYTKLIENECSTKYEKDEKNKVKDIKKDSVDQLLQTIVDKPNESLFTPKKSCEFISLNVATSGDTKLKDIVSISNPYHVKKHFQPLTEFYAYEKLCLPKYMTYTPASKIDCVENTDFKNVALEPIGIKK